MSFPETPPGPRPRRPVLGAASSSGPTRVRPTTGSAASP